jgi:hypothetical protein
MPIMDINIHISDPKCLMKKFEVTLKQKGTYVENPRLNQVNDLYKSVTNQIQTYLDFAYVNCHDGINLSYPF